MHKIKTFPAALLAALVYSEIILPDNLAESLTRELSTVVEGPQAAIDNEADCVALDATFTSSWYDYRWVEDGCYCEHHWKKGKVVERCENKGKLANPFYLAYSNENKCITQAEFDADPRTKCVEPVPPPSTCTELYGGSRGFASAYLTPSGEANNWSLDYISKYETGVVHFQEMCADDENGTCGGDPCDGVCVTGAFYGIKDVLRPERNPDKYEHQLGLHVHKYGTPNPSLPKGCTNGGEIWNPAGLEDHYYIDESDDGAVKAGTLKNLFDGYDNVEGGQCLKSTYAYCKPHGELALNGPNSIIGRSLILQRQADYGSCCTDEIQYPVACGTIGTQVYDLETINLRPTGATTQEGQLCETL